MRVGIVVLFSDEHDIRLRQLSRHRLEVAELPGGRIEHAMRHIALRQKRHGQGHASPPPPRHTP
jgi:hypothetical protein